MLANKAALQAYSAAKERASVALPGGEMALIRGLTVRASEKFQAALEMGNEHAQRVLVALSLCDEGGALILDPDQAQDLALLDEMPTPAFLALQKAIIAHNGLDPEAADAAGEPSAATHG